MVTAQCPSHRTRTACQRSMHFQTSQSGYHPGTHLKMECCRNQAESEGPKLPPPPVQAPDVSLDALLHSEQAGSLAVFSTR